MSNDLQSEPKDGIEDVIQREGLSQHLQVYLTGIGEMEKIRLIEALLGTELVQDLKIEGKAFQKGDFTANHALDSLHETLGGYEFTEDEIENYLEKRVEQTKARIRRDVLDAVGKNYPALKGKDMGFAERIDNAKPALELNTRRP